VVEGSASLLRRPEYIDKYSVGFSLLSLGFSEKQRPTDYLRNILSRSVNIVSNNCEQYCEGFLLNELKYIQVEQDCFAPLNIQQLIN